MKRQQGQLLPQVAGEFQFALLDALGFDRRVTREVVAFQGHSVGIPVLARVGRSEEADALWILEVREDLTDDQWGQDPLGLSYKPELYVSNDVALPDEKHHRTGSNRWWDFERAETAPLDHGCSLWPRSCCWTVTSGRTSGCCALTWRLS